MVKAGPADAVEAAAVRMALEPFMWQSFTAAALCRRAAAAMDAAGVRSRPSLHCYSSEECVEALVEALSSCHWRSLTVDGLSRFLVRATQAWQQEQAWFDFRLGLLLDGMS